MIFLILLACVVGILLYMWVAHYISYTMHKHYLLKKSDWDLNICCGKTDVGKINADIVQHGPAENFQLIKNIYNLPFEDKQFNTVLCSHTMEHVEDPKCFFKELQRVGKNVTIIIPPLYDISAVFNILEHKWVFWTFRKKFVDQLPRHTKLPGAEWLHRCFGQVKKG